VVALVLSAPTAVAQDEWPDSEDEAPEVGEGTYEGTVGSADDEDELKIPVEQGDTVTLTLEKPIRRDTELRVEWPGNQRGVTVADESAEQLERKVTVEENGFVQVELTSDTADQGPEDWTLHVDRNEGADEWRDDEDTATEVGPGVHAGSLSSPDDEDELKIPVEQGDTVNLTLFKPIRKDVELRVEWPGNQRGTTIADESARRLSREVTAEENGFVQVELTSDTVRTGEEPWSLGLNAEPNDVGGSTATPTPDPTATATPTPDQRTATPDRRTPADTETATRTRPPTPTAYETAGPGTPTSSPTPRERGAETPVTASPPPEYGEGTPTDDTATGTVPDDGSPTPQDSDDDGVPDSEDYAPRDPDVQEESDLDDEEPTASGGMPGFGPVAVALALLTGGLLARRAD
jgi:hypothetical protein